MVPTASRGAIGPDELGGAAQHIAAVAAKLFAERGYDATSVREVAEAAGVTKPTLYYYFGSKEKLAQALLAEPIRRLIAAFRAILEQEADAVRLVKRMTEQAFALCCEDPDRSRLFHSLVFGPQGSSLVIEFESYFDEVDRLWLEAGRKLAAAGVVEAGRAEAFIVNLRGVTILHTMMFLYRGIPLDPGLPERLVEDLLRGFAAEGVNRSW